MAGLNTQQQTFYVNRYFMAISNCYAYRAQTGSKSYYSLNVLNLRNMLCNKNDTFCLFEMTHHIWAKPQHTFLNQGRNKHNLLIFSPILYFIVIEDALIMNTLVHSARTLYEQRNQNGNKQWETCTTKILTFWFQLVNHSLLFIDHFMLTSKSWSTYVYCICCHYISLMEAKRKIIKIKKVWKKS